MYVTYRIYTWLIRSCICVKKSWIKQKRLYNTALYTCQTCNPKPIVFIYNEFDITPYNITNDI